MTLKNEFSNILPLAVTMGDPSGIGPDLILKMWQRRRDDHIPPFFLIACPKMLAQRIDQIGSAVIIKEISTAAEAVDIFETALPVLNLPEGAQCQKDIVPGMGQKENAKAIIGSIEEAVRLVQNGEAAAVVTNPINKEVLYDAGFNFPGHTEFLAALATQKGEEPVFPVMMLASDQLKVVPVTIHIALSEVREKLTPELLIKNCQITSDAFQYYFGLEKPRLAIAGMNPHAGEGGSMGTDENDIIIPTIEKMRKMGLEVSGPHPADTLFHEKARQNYDVVMGMYHDQVLIPIKTLAFDEGVNVTLGLPFIRTSPDHGTAYDIAGTGTANPRSLIEATLMAARMAQTKTKS